MSLTNILLNIGILYNSIVNPPLLVRSTLIYNVTSMSRTIKQMKSIISTVNFSLILEGIVEVS